MDQFRWVLDITFVVAVCWYIELQVNKTKKWVEGLVASAKTPVDPQPKIVYAGQFVLVERA